MPRSVADIQSDLDAAYASRRTAMQAQSYSLDTGQGKQLVNRADLSSIQDTIRQLEGELEDATGTGGNFHATLERR